MTVPFGAKVLIHMRTMTSGQVDRRVKEQRNNKDIF